MDIKNEKRYLNEHAKYETVEIVLEIMECLKKYTDEEHSLSTSELIQLINQEYGTNRSSNSVKKILVRMLKSNIVNPPRVMAMEGTAAYYKDYRIFYDGYEKFDEENPVDANLMKEQVRNNRRNIKTRERQLKNSTVSLEEKRLLQSELRYLKKSNEQEERILGKRNAPLIKGLRYRHEFSNADLNLILSSIFSSSFISPEKKQELAEKVKMLGSKNYRYVQKDLHKSKKVKVSELSNEAPMENIFDTKTCDFQRVQFYTLKLQHALISEYTKFFLNIF